MPKPPKGLIRNQIPRSVKQLGYRASKLVQEASDGSDILVYETEDGHAEIKAVLISYALYERAVKGKRP